MFRKPFPIPKGVVSNRTNAKSLPPSAGSQRSLINILGGTFDMSREAASSAATAKIQKSKYNLPHKRARTTGASLKIKEIKHRDTGISSTTFRLENQDTVAGAEDSSFPRTFPFAYIQPHQRSHSSRTISQPIEEEEQHGASFLLPVSLSETLPTSLDYSTLQFDLSLNLTHTDRPGEALDAVLKIDVRKCCAGSVETGACRSLTRSAHSVKSRGFLSNRRRSVLTWT